MSSLALEIWRQIQTLSPDEQQELRDRLINDVLPRPPHYFEELDSPHEIAQLNQLAAESRVELPRDLE